MTVQMPSDGSFRRSRSPDNTFQSSLQYPHIHPRYAYHSHPPAPEYQGVLPSNAGIESTRSGGLCDGMSGQWSSYSSQDPTGRLGTPFADQSMALVHASLKLMMSEVQWLSARMSDLVELEGQRTQAMEQFDTRLNKMERRVDALEAFSADRNGASAKTSAGNSKGGSNNTPLLKVR
jgi:hypothetical protein